MRNPLSTKKTETAMRPSAAGPKVWPITTSHAAAPRTASSAGICEPRESRCCKDWLSGATEALDCAVTNTSPGSEYLPSYDTRSLTTILSASKLRVYNLLKNSFRECFVTGHDITDFGKTRPASAS